jgi:two-component system chemotaxis sensor kinase CheA
MNDPAAALRGAFHDEARSRIDSAVDGLLELERGTGGAEALAHVLREFHSIKGAAGMMGYDEVYAIAHAAEDLLAEARSRGSLPPAMVEPLLRAADAIMRGVGGESGIAGEAVRELTLAASSAGGAAPAGPDRPAPAAAPSEEAPRTIRMEAGKVDRLLDAVGEAVLHHRRLEHVARGAVERTAEDLLDRGELLLDELQDAVIALRTMPLEAITGPFPRAVRELASRHEKAVDLEVRGAETALDRVILDGLRQPLTHLLRNSVAHGIEPPAERRRAGKPERGRIELRAEPRGERVRVAVSDDGRGVSGELLERAAGRPLADVLTEPGLSTAAAVTDLSGRGVGLDAVRRDVEALGGALEIESEPGRGTTVTLLLPVTLTLLHVLLVERGPALVAVPVSAVEEAVIVENVMSLEGRTAIEVRGAATAVVDLAEALGGSAPALAARSPAVVVTGGGRRAALACDGILGDEEIVVKRLSPLLDSTPGYLGVTILADGRIAFVLDPVHAIRARARIGEAAPPAPERRTTPKILVVDDQFTVRELQRSILEVAGYRVETARTGREAWQRLGEHDDIELVITDIEMPEMDGLELLAAIRRRPDRSTLPVVVLTSRASPDDERRGLEAGADAYIVKERFGQEALLETVRRLVAR